jgi:hypothetical protein
VTGLCHHCRLRVAYDSLECPNCGTPHPVDPDDEPVTTALPPPTLRAFDALMQQPVKKPSRSKTGWWIAGFVLLGLTLAWLRTGGVQGTVAEPVPVLATPDQPMPAVPGEVAKPVRAVEAAPPKASLEVGRTYYLATADSYRGVIACVTADGLRRYQALIQEGKTAEANKLLVQVGARNHDVADDLAMLLKRKACTTVSSGKKDAPLHLQVAQVDGDVVAGHLSNTWAWFTEPLLWTLKAYVRGDQVYARTGADRR